MRAPHRPATDPPALACAPVPTHAALSPGRPPGSRGRTRWRPILVLVALVAAACSQGADTPSPDTASDPASTPAAAGPSAGTYVGRVDGTDALVAVVVDDDGGAVIYVCDGEDGIAEWYDTDHAAATGDLVAGSGTRLTATADGTSISGTFVDGEGRAHAFRAETAGGDAGLYMPPPSVDEPDGRTGWVVADDGTVRGAVRRGRRVTPAPTFGPTVRLGRRVTTPVRLGSRTPVNAPVVAAPSSPPLRAAFDWAMPDRWAASWDAWGVVVPGGGREPLLGYDPEFVHPDAWHPTFDACASTGPSPLVAFDWAVTRDGTPVDTATSGGCRLANDPAAPDAERLDFPAQGTYTVTLTVTDADGASSAVTHEVRVRDLLIVSMGDSSASGEGNPETLALAAELVGSEAFLFQRCHRSRTSGHSLAARAIEQADPHVSVTFLSFACSGATVPHGILGPYGGIDPGDAAEDLPPQLEQALRAVCRVDIADCGLIEQRLIDRLFIAIGINDIGFSDVVLACAIDQNCDTDREVAARVARGLTALADRDGRPDTSIADIARRLGEVHLPVDRVFLTSYPDNPFADRQGHPQGGCGAFVELSKRGSRWLHDRGRELNATLRAAAVAADFGFAEGIADAFASHGYCVSDTWFRYLSTSFIAQFGKSGVLHPTPEGHRAIADAMVRAVDEFTPFVPALDVTVTVEAVRITENASAVQDGRSRLGHLLASTGTRQLSLVTQVFATRRGQNVDGQQVVYSNEFTVGKWSPVPAGDLTFELRVGDGDELDAVFGLPTGGLVIRDHQPLPLVHDRRTLVVSGVRERDGLQVEVRYVIETTPRQLVAP